MSRKRVGQHASSELRRRRNSTTRPLTHSLLFVAAISCGGRTSVSDLELTDVEGDVGTGANAGTGARTGASSGGQSSGGGSGGTLVGGSGGTSAGGSGGAVGGAGGNHAGGSGGALAGGTGGILVGGSGGGGDFAGGAPAGGQGGGDNEPNCPFGSWFNGAVCEEWTQCQPGEYVEYFGSKRFDRTCAPCPPEGYTSTENAGACRYNGCEFSEVVVTPGSSTAPAECAPRPGFFPIAPGNSYLLGFATSGTRVYAALASSTEAQFHGFEGEVSLEPLRYSLEGQQEPNAFAIAPDGTFYLSGFDPLLSGRVWLDAIAPDASSALRIAVTDASYSGRTGLVSTPSHWIHWHTEYDDSGYEVVIRARTHAHVLVGETRIADSDFFHVSASSADQIFLLLSDTTQQLYRLVDLTLPLQKVPLPGTFFPTFSTATSAGEAYAVGLRWADEHTVEVYQVGSDGSVTEHFEHRFEEYAAEPVTAAVDPGRALYILCSSWIPSYFPRNKLHLLRFDLLTGESTVEELGGGTEDWAGYLGVTTDGSVYIAGGTASFYFVRKVH
ncbi:MAG: hypothetical protein B6A08_13580 [Sorangiineae bacterium NIC37A_2]|nr:MAG: hypothetical protein B6A08_13580 [Sorangiineae bacterium NIC37A_2]